MISASSTSSAMYAIASLPSTTKMLESCPTKTESVVDGHVCFPPLLVKDKNTLAAECFGDARTHSETRIGTSTKT